MLVQQMARKWFSLTHPSPLENMCFESFLYNKPLTSTYMNPQGCSDACHWARIGVFAFV
jgi:hypothetical protein